MNMLTIVSYMFLYLMIIVIELFWKKRLYKVSVYKKTSENYIPEVLNDEGVLLLLQSKILFQHIS